MNHPVKALLALLVLFFLPSPAVPGTEPGAWTLDDFEDGNLKSPNGLSWILIADDLGGGGSETQITIQPGARGSRHALRLAGRLDGAHGWPFAGAWLNLEGTGRSVSLAAFEGIRLRVKGPARLQVGFRAGITNFMAPIEAGPEWKMVEVPLASLAPEGKVPEGTRFNPEAVQVFGVTTPQLPRGDERPPDRVAFEVDDVTLYARGARAPLPVPTGPAGPVSTLPFTPLSAIPSEGWIELAVDPDKDGRIAGLPDATRLETIPNSADGMIWIRVTLREPPHRRWMGMNLALDLDGDPDDGMAWWGTNKSFKFDRLASAWCFQVSDGCQGFIGLADDVQVAAGNMAGLGAEKVRFAIDTARRAYVMGIPREALGAVKGEIRLVAAVGSALLYADDVPGQGAIALH